MFAGAVAFAHSTEPFNLLSIRIGRGTRAKFEPIPKSKIIKVIGGLILINAQFLYVAKCEPVIASYVPISTRTREIKGLAT